MDLASSSAKSIRWCSRFLLIRANKNFYNLLRTICKYPWANFPQNTKNTNIGADFIFHIILSIFQPYIKNMISTRISFWIRDFSLSCFPQPHYSMKSNHPSSLLFVSLPTKISGQCWYSTLHCTPQIAAHIFLQIACPTHKSPACPDNYSHSCSPRLFWALPLSKLQLFVSAKPPHYWMFFYHWLHKLGWSQKLPYSR